MILFPQKKLFYLSGFLAILFAPFLFFSLPSWFESINLLILVLLAIEFSVYFISGVIHSGYAMMVPIFIYSLIMLISRSLFCLLATVIYLMMNLNVNITDTFITLWVGNPISQLIQVFMMVFYSPHIIKHVAPGLLNSESIESFHKEEQGGRVLMSKESYFAEPLGGFIRTYSFTELQACFRKTIGLEGFLIFSEEGLIVWEDIAINFDLEKITVKFQKLNKYTENFIEDFDLKINERLILETPEHLIFNVKINDWFYLSAFFNRKVSLSDVYPRMKVLIKSTKELLDSKYQGLYN